MSDHFCNISSRLHSALYRLAERVAPNDIELLGAIGSIGDTLSDDECAGLLEDWLQPGKVLHGEH